MSVFLTLTHYFINGETSGWYIPNGGNTGIGNMLFQIASAYSFAKKHGTKLYVPGLAIFFQKEQLQKSDTIFRNICDECPNAYFSAKPSGIPIENHDIWGQPYIPNMELSHYFENYRNFDENRNEILTLFGPTDLDKAIIWKKYPMLQTPDNTLCSIHIRMGPDYKIIYRDDPGYLRNLEESYYRCLDHMIARGIRRVFVFTNDKPYCHYLLNQNSKYSNLEFIYSDERDFVDIWMISMIPNNIVSVSTLAWWGSYLNSNPNKYIICANGVRDDLHYPGWVVL